MAEIPEIENREAPDTRTWNSASRLILVLDP